MTASTADVLRFSYAPRGPYSLVATASRFTRWPEAVDRFDGTTYRRLIPVGRGTALLQARQSGTVSRAILRVRLEGAGARSEAARAAARRIVEIGLGAGLDTQAFYRRFRDDPLIAGALRHSRGLRVAGTASLWEALVTAVLAQQVNLVFAYDIRRELSVAFGRRGRFGGETYVAFPTPHRMAQESEAALRRFRLSRAKAGAISRLACAFASGELSEAELAPLSDEAAIERLTAIKGVGPWTAETGLLRGLGRVDVFPGGDLGVVKSVAMELLGHRARVTERRMRRYADRWRPYRGLALVYAYAEIARRRSAK